MTVARRVLLVLLAALLLGEGAGRLAGLHTPLLYEPTAYGYRVVPGQDIVRFGNRVHYSAAGLRSEAVAAEPDAAVLRVLCLGDSITFGGTQADQAETYPYLLEQRLRERGFAAEVLNASAGGWAPENEAGWLAANGLQGAHVLVLELATHDLFQGAAEASVVGSHPSFPSHAPRFALGEVATRYVWPRLRRQPVDDPGAGAPGAPTAASEQSFSAIDRIEQMARAAGVRLVIVLVEQPAALERRDEMAAAAKQRLTAFARERGATLVRTGEAIEARGGAALFRDGLHPNAHGNAVLADLLVDALTTGRAPGVETSAP
jgi:lysophospholipase L1-like esterase